LHAFHQQKTPSAASRSAPQTPPAIIGRTEEEPLALEGEGHTSVMLVAERLTDVSARPLGRQPFKPGLLDIHLNKQKPTNK
jgi:hypothetical protein